MPDNTRDAHPYYMYDHIQAQPDAWSKIVARVRDQARDVAAAIQDSRGIYFVGTGTSFHAAQTGENILRAYGGDRDYRAMGAFEFALYTPKLAPTDTVIVFSHRGTKNYSVESLKRAKAAGCRTVLITGEGAHAAPTPGLVDYVFVTVPQEQSSAHTFSYYGAVAVISVLAQELGRVSSNETQLDDELLTVAIPHALQTALATENEMTRLAKEFANRRRIWIVGGGPAAIVAHETALKIKETSYSQAEGLATETMIHGPFQAVEAEDIFFLIAPQGAARSRTLEIAGMIQEIGAPYVVVSDAEESEAERSSNAWVRVPRVPEPFSTLTHLIPMQLFTYHLALVKGRNPDIFRRDDPRFDRMSARIKL